MSSKKEIKDLGQIIKKTIDEWLSDPETEKTYLSDEFEELESRIAWDIGEWYIDTKEIVKGNGLHSLGHIKEKFKEVVMNLVSSCRELKAENKAWKLIFSTIVKTTIVSTADSVKLYADTINLVEKSKESE